jgi:hypothetical protein
VVFGGLGASVILICTKLKKIHYTSVGVAQHLSMYTRCTCLIPHYTPVRTRLMPPHSRGLILLADFSLWIGATAVVG